MTNSGQVNILQSAADSLERREYRRAIDLLEPLINLGNMKAKSYLAEIYWHGEEVKDLKRAARLQQELNEIYDPRSEAYAMGILRETLMLLDDIDHADNARLNSLFVNLKDSRYDRNLLLAASIAKSERIETREREKPLVLYLKAFRRATSFNQKLRILGLVSIELIKPSKGVIGVAHRQEQKK